MHYSFPSSKETTESHLVLLSEGAQQLEKGRICIWLRHQEL